MTRNTHTIIRNIGGEYIKQIVPADPEPNPVPPKRKRPKHTAQVLHAVDKKIPHGEIVEMFEKSETYMDVLVSFHEDAMALFTDLVNYPFYLFKDESNRLQKLTQIEAMIAQGKEIGRQYNESTEWIRNVSNNPALSQRK